MMPEWIRRDRVLRLRRLALGRMALARWLRRDAEALSARADRIEASSRPPGHDNDNRKAGQ